MKELFEQLVEMPSPYNSKVAKVTAVDTSKRTCDVEPIDGTAEIFDVRLQAFVDNTEGVVLFPKKGSMVVVTLLSIESAFVSQTSEIDYWQVKKSDVDLSKEIEKMFDLTGDLIALLKQFQLMTNMGATVQVMPNVQLELEKLNQKNKAIKSEIAKILK
jgi:hypothetical protein